MYSPEQADIDPRNPVNLSDDVYRYIVADYVWSGKSTTLTDILCKDFMTEDEAISVLLSLPFQGEELDVVRLDEEGDDMVMACFEWDYDQNKYVGA